MVASEATPTLDGLAAQGSMSWVRRPFTDTDVDHTWLVVAATGRPDVDSAVAAAARQRRIFCVRTDDADGATARTPTTARSGNTRLGVLAGGRGTTRAVRDRLRDALDTAPAAPDDRPARRIAAAGLGRVALVGAGPGAEDLITVRGRRLLQQADVVVADRLVPPALLADLGDPSDRRPRAATVDRRCRRADPSFALPLRAPHELHHRSPTRSRAVQSMTWVTSPSGVIATIALPYGDSTPMSICTLPVWAFMVQ